ncbi:hypothetical protein I4U23_001330 [Adineta vaga]|nr:hypothetical protein I4U23_001330 [Adineta vaga]
MGNCSNSIGITMNIDVSSLFYFTGDKILGNVSLIIPNDKIEAEAIYIKLTGEIGYRTNRITSNRTRRREKRREYHHIPFYSSTVCFVRPESGQKELILSQGNYSWPFEFLIPDQLPPTINQSQIYPHVRYYLQVIIDKSWYKPNTREIKYLTIYPHVNILKTPQHSSSIQFFNQNRKDIVVKGTINKSGYVAGESINVTLEIDNSQQILIQRIDVAMFQGYRIGKMARGFSLFQISLPNIINTKEFQFKEQFSVPIPSLTMPPTYKYQGTQGTILVDIHYFLKLAVKVEGLFTNFDVDMPFILGTEPKLDTNQQSLFKSLNVNFSSKPDQLVSDDDDDLVSDHELMHEES